MSHIRAIVVEDSPVSLRAVSHLLGLQPRINVVGTANDGKTGLEMARRLAPDVVFTDCDMPGMGGLALVECLRREMPSSRLVIISVHEGIAWENLSVSHGADAFVSKQNLGDELPELLCRLFPSAPSKSTRSFILPTPPPAGN